MTGLQWRSFCSIIQINCNSKFPQNSHIFALAFHTLLFKLWYYATIIYQPSSAQYLNTSHIQTEREYKLELILSLSGTLGWNLSFHGSFIFILDVIVSSWCTIAWLKGIYWIEILFSKEISSVMAQRCEKGSGNPEESPRSQFVRQLSMDRRTQDKKQWGKL